MRAAVIGGGITGLSVARELLARGHEVTLFERDARAGGLAGSFRVGDVWVERFYHHIFKTDGAVLDWIGDLGLAGRLVWRPSPVGFFHGGGVHRFGTPLDLLRFRPLRPMERVRMGLAILRLQRMEDWSALDRVTCGEWFSRHVGANAYRVVWEPLLRLKFGGSYDRIPAAWIWGRIHPRARSRSRGGMREELGYLDGGFERMIERLKEEIVARGGVLREGVPVTGVIAEGGAVRGVLAGGTEAAFDAAVCTVPIPEFLKIAPPLPGADRARLEGIDYQAVVCLVMECRESISPVYWLNVSDPRITFGGLIEHTNFIPPERYGGRRIVYLFNYVDADDPLWRMDADSYFRAHEASLRLVNPAFRREWVERTHLFRARHGTVVYTLGYRDRMPPFETAVRGLSLVNTSQIYPYDRNMNNCAALGRRFVEERMGEGRR
ncbi:MAG: NAD(P)/FAD-dependent oxidoreductase [bacterium]|nr:NAD(P)/FAD-dependent oxidoreductase [bacterium]